MAVSRRLIRREVSWKDPVMVRDRQRPERGIGHKDAMIMGNTRKKPWRISRTPTLNFALPLSLFVQKKGLLLLG